MSTVEKKDLQLSKLTQEQLLELFERQTNLLKNVKLIAKLPDKGAQLKNNLEKIEKQLKLRENMQNIEIKMSTLSVSNDNEKDHIQHICNMEKTPEKERYKPSYTIKNRTKAEKATQLIPLKQSIDLLVEQENRLKENAISTRVSSDDDEDDSDDDSTEEPVLHS